MSIRALTDVETEALLSSLSERDCGQGCKCIFCRTFEEGYQSGRDDAALEFRRTLERVSASVGRNAKRQDAKTGLARKGEHAVPEGETPNA